MNTEVPTTDAKQAEIPPSAANQETPANFQTVFRKETEIGCASEQCLGRITALFDGIEPR